MSKKMISREQKVGQAPGMTIHLGEQRVEQIKITLIDYDGQGLYLERETTDLPEAVALAEQATVTWVNVVGLHDIEVVEALGRSFNIHPLLLEDMLNTDQRPKTEEYDTYSYIILKKLSLLAAIEVEQVSLVVGQTFVLTFLEREDDFLEPLRQRLRDDKNRIRRMGADFLAYSIIDAVVDQYFLILEQLGDDIEVLEEELTRRPSPDDLFELQSLKSDLILLRKVVWPLREVIGGLQRGESALFRQETLIYLRDIYEHTIQVMETVETYRDIVSGLLEIYLTSVAQKTNEVMKVLTIIATIFIPLTFITSLYGMNFRHMPELSSRWGYPLVWLTLLVISGLMLLYFKRKGWL